MEIAARALLFEVGIATLLNITGVCKINGVFAVVCCGKTYGITTVNNNDNTVYFANTGISEVFIVVVVLCFVDGDVIAIVVVGGGGAGVLVLAFVVTVDQHWRSYVCSVWCPVCGMSMIVVGFAVTVDTLAVTVDIISLVTLFTEDSALVICVACYCQCCCHCYCRYLFL